MHFNAAEIDYSQKAPLGGGGGPGRPGFVSGVEGEKQPLAGAVFLRKVGTKVLETGPSPPV